MADESKSKPNDGTTPEVQFASPDTTVSNLEETEITEISKHDLKGYLKRLFNSDSPESFAYKNNKDNYRFFEVEVIDDIDTIYEQFYITDIKEQSFVAVEVCIETKAQEFTDSFDFKIKYL